MPAWITEGGGSISLEVCLHHSVTGFCSYITDALFFFLCHLPRLSSPNPAVTYYIAKGSSCCTTILQKAQVVALAHQNALSTPSPRHTRTQKKLLTLAGSMTLGTGSQIRPISRDSFLGRRGYAAIMNSSLVCGPCKPPFRSGWDLHQQRL